MKELLDKKRAQENYQSQLAGALNRYKPPEENEFGERKMPSRGGVNMNIYEKAFFDNGGKDMMLNGGKSLKADSALVPVDQNYGMTNYFNKGTIKKTENPMKAGGIPVFESSPEALKNTNAYGMSPEKSYGISPDIPTINTNIKRQVDKSRVKYQYGQISDDKPSMKADDTFDFINKINGVGGNNDGKKFGRQNSLSKKVDELKSNRLNESNISINTKNLAEKIDFDVFPSLPDYDGIQNNFLDNTSKKDNGAKLDSSMISDTNNLKRYNLGGKIGGIRDSTTSLGNQTTNTIKTINSINLEKINNRNENRLNDIENKYDFHTDDELTKLENSSYHKMKSSNSNNFDNSAIKLDGKSNYMGDYDMNPIKEEKFEETFKKQLQSIHLIIK